MYSASFCHESRSFKETLMKSLLDFILRWNQCFPKSMELIASIFLFQVLSKALHG